LPDDTDCTGTTEINSKLVGRNIIKLFDTNLHATAAKTAVLHNVKDSEHALLSQRGRAMLCVRH